LAILSDRGRNLRRGSVTGHRGLTARHSFTSLDQLSALQRSSDAAKFILTNFGVQSRPLKHFSEMKDLNLGHNDADAESKILAEFFILHVMASDFSVAW
jgi:hypothetical protein